MIYRNEKYLIFIAILTLIFLAGCKKEKAPVVSTNEGISNVTESTATSGGNITDDGGAVVTARGVCWSINTSPSTAESKTTDGSGTGSFSSNISGLSGGESYYIRAYATNCAGTGYGLAILFKTPSMSPGPPIAITLPAQSISKVTGAYLATLCGSVYANYSNTSYTFEYGTTENYEIGDLSSGSVNGGAYTSVQYTTGGFQMSTLYHYRITATNSYGIVYGDDMTFTMVSK